MRRQGNHAPLPGPTAIHNTLDDLARHLRIHFPAFHHDGSRSVPVTPQSSIIDLNGACLKARLARPSD